MRYFKNENQKWKVERIDSNECECFGYLVDLHVIVLVVTTFFIFFKLLYPGM